MTSLKDIPIVDENTLDNAACGVAAATMVLDHYLPQSGPIQKALDIKAVAIKNIEKYQPEGQIYLILDNARYNHAIKVS